MNYQEAIDYIESLSPTLAKPGLERFALFMDEQARLQDQCASLHVAGTNGKGSVVSMLAETLNQSGLKTGRYTGPHLISFNERFQVQGKSISNEALAQICSELKLQSEAFGLRHPEHGPLTWFEIITALAFIHFARSKADVSVYEVGLGGRWDATNVLSAPLVTAIVTVSLDHTHILGPEVADIASEKAGVLKKGVPLVTACKGEALAVILQEAQAKNVPVICTGARAELYCQRAGARERQYVEALEKRYAGLATPVSQSVAKQGGYQRLNASVAAAVLGIWELESGKACLDSFDSALSKYFWPGRLQYFQEQELILDGAHNQAGARALKESLDELFPNKTRCFILCFYQSKQFREILAELLRPGDLVFASQTTGRRPVVPAQEIVMTARALACQSTLFASLEEAFKAAAELDKRAYVLVGSGSFASVSAGLKFLGYDNPEDSQSASANLWQPAGR